VRPLFVTSGQAAGRPPPPGVDVVGDLEAATGAVLGWPAGRPAAIAPPGMRA